MDLPARVASPPTVFKTIQNWFIRRPVARQQQLFFLVAGGNSRGKRDYLLAFGGIVRFFLCGVAFPWLIFSENVRRLPSGWELLGFVGRPLESH